MRNRNLDRVKSVRRRNPPGALPSSSNHCLDGEHPRCATPCACPCHLTDEQWFALMQVEREARPFRFINQRIVRKLALLGLVVEADHWVRITPFGRQVVVSDEIRSAREGGQA